MCDEHALYNKSKILLILYIVRCTNTQHRQFHLNALKPDTPSPRQGIMAENKRLNTEPNP